MNSRKANWSLLFVSLVWGGGFIAASAALDTFSPFMTMAVRFGLSSVILLILYWKKVKGISRSHWKKGGLCGVFLFFAFAFQTVGLKYTTASKNAFLTAANVVIIPYLLWIIHRKKPKPIQVISSLICVSGVGMLTLEGDLSLGRGDLLSIICALFFALHMLSLEAYGKLDHIQLTFMQMSMAALLSVICTIFFEQPPAVITAKSVGSLMFLVLFSTLLAYLIQTKAQQYTKASVASLIMSCEAVFAAVLSFLILRERISPFMVIGIILIFGAIQISLKHGEA